MSAHPESARKKQSSSPSIAWRVFISSVGLTLSVGFAFGAAHWYEPPHLGGSVTRGVWLEPDFWCSVAAAVSAIGCGVWSTRIATSAGAVASGSPLLRGVIWFTLTLPLLLAWLDSIGLFALLVAPAQGYAALRAVGLWSKWRTDAALNPSK